VTLTQLEKVNYHYISFMWSCSEPNSSTQSSHVLLGHTLVVTMVIWNKLVKLRMKVTH